jgi:uncharacterized membrane protein YqjE
MNRFSQESGTIHRIGASVCSLLQTRLELLGIDLADQKDRLVSALLGSLLALLLGALSLLLVTAAIAAAYWDTYRWQSLLAMAAAYAIIALAFAAKSRSGLRRAPPMFEATLAELEKDRKAIEQL